MTIQQSYNQLMEKLQKDQTLICNLFPKPNKKFYMGENIILMDYSTKGIRQVENICGNCDIEIGHKWNEIEELPGINFQLRIVKNRVILTF